jgi:GT2 family glycosyltransferase
MGGVELDSLAGGEDRRGHLLYYGSMPSVDTRSVHRILGRSHMTSMDVIITSHNRREKTLGCLTSLTAQSSGLDLRVVLVDAGSTDGTRTEVAARFPDVLLVEADDDVFWGQGMRIAAAHAREDSDYHLWLNDDVVLAGSALADLLEWGAPDRIVVGKLEDDQGLPSYGGLLAHPRRRLTLRPAPVADDLMPVDTLNGNVVLVGRAVREVLGPVRGDLFPHAFGDIDYGYTARGAGFEVVQAPGIVGTCSHNPPPASRRLPTLRARWKAVVSTKELPPSMWRRACFRHGGALAPAYFVLPYLRVLRPPAGSSS